MKAPTKPRQMGSGSVTGFILMEGAKNNLSNCFVRQEVIACTSFAL